MIKVTLDGKVYKINKKMKVIDFMRDVLKNDDRKIIACKAFNEVKSLNYLIDRDCEIKLLTTQTSDGSKIYVRGITFVFGIVFTSISLTFIKLNNFKLTFTFLVIFSLFIFESV